VKAAARLRAPRAGVASNNTRATTETPPHPPDTARSRSRRRRALLLVALVGVLAIPMIVALVALIRPRWYPLLDMAWTELLVRDVWGSHPPLVGLAGRIGTAANQGSHPGPLSFYALWPVYRLFGASSWALEVSSVALQVAAIAVALWIANRRGGPWLAVALAVVLAVLLRGFGASMLTQPWNPYLPVLWWLVFLLAVWSVFCDDLALLPVAAVAGSFCAQTEVAYLGIATGIGVVALGVAATRAYLRRRDGASVRRFATWALVGLGVSVLVWLPPLVEQLTTAHGNFALLFNYFTHPPQAPVGVSQGVRVMLAHLNPIAPFTKTLVPAGGNYVGAGSSIPGAVFLAVWAASVVAAWRRRLHPVIELDALLAVAVVLGAASTSRIFGLLWYYLLLWGWIVDGLMVVAVGWTIVVVANDRLRTGARHRFEAAAGAALGAMLVAFTLLFTVEAASVQMPTPFLAEELRAVVGPTVHALDHHVGPADGPRGRYLVTFTDPNSLGSQAFGLLNELERSGFHVGMTAGFRAEIAPHRVLDPGQATAVVHLAVGSDIATWRAKPDAVEVAYSDPRHARQRSEYDRLHAEVVAELTADGRLADARQVDANLVGLSLDQSVPARIRTQLGRMDDLGLPIAVFVAPSNLAS
jgi:hypothetical protein